MVEYIKHWKFINNREFIGKINESNNEIINDILIQLYLNNNNNITNKKYFAIINCQGEKILSYSINEFNNLRETILTEKMDKINIKTQCIIVYHTDSNNNNISIYRYPNGLTNEDLTHNIDYFYKETNNYLPTIEDIKNNSFHNIHCPNYLIENLLFGEIRNKLINLIMKTNLEEVIIFIIFPSNFQLEKKIKLQLIDKKTSLKFAEESKFNQHIKLFDKYNSKLDLFSMFTISENDEDSYYRPLIIQNYIFLKNIYFRKNFFDYMYFEKNKINKFYNNLLNTPFGFAINNMFHTKFSKTDITINKLWQKFINNEIDINVSNKIKQKIKSYKQTDKEKFNIDNDLTLENVIKILISYNYKCDECGKEIIIDYKKGCYRQFSLDRINDNNPHNYDNIRLCCLSCNINHKKNIYYSGGLVFNDTNDHYISNITECKNCHEHIQSYC